MAYYHGNGDPGHPLVAYEYEEVKTAIAQEQANKETGWKDLFSTPGLRRRSFIIMGLSISGQWSGNGMVTFYLNQVLTSVGLTNKVNQLGINVGISAWNFICGFCAGMTCDIFGRRRLLLISTTGMLVFFIGVTICSAEYVQLHSAASGDLVILFIFLFTGFYALGWSSVMLLYCLEIMPYSLRAKGDSLHAITQASFQVFNQYANPVAFAGIAWKYYIVFDCIIAAILVFVYFFIIETKGLTLEETGLLFDGKAAVDSLKGKAADHVAETEPGLILPDPEKGSISHKETSA